MIPLLILSRAARNSGHLLDSTYINQPLKAWPGIFLDWSYLHRLPQIPSTTLLSQEQKPNQSAPHWQLTYIRPRSKVLRNGINGTGMMKTAKTVKTAKKAKNRMSLPRHPVLRRHRKAASIPCSINKGDNDLTCLLANVSLPFLFCCSLFGAPTSPLFPGFEWYFLRQNLEADLRSTIVLTNLYMDRNPSRCLR